ncbi:mitochondrial carrier domain-containing protein [Kockovaella imperatae]|uniref:Mitochondrial carrier domain-containing protein n=1 Tax=Kockovaella imperatae TaxID=4999 RepID=A0A1Y1USN6_9TREE|nr:mitochondrial carrier domain-containing protein [Kockovaella imperatae]ORX41028.1 mitochondrial carrier domain-containing protein [Kockovaella imperatae]
MDIEKNVNKVSPAVDFSAGVLAGVTGLIAGQPFDVVKCRFQTVQYAGRYDSTFSALRSILKEERVAGLFKGVTSPMAGIAFINGVVFTSYSMFMNLQLPNADSDVSEPSLAKICLAGAGSGVLASLIACPTELVKIRQQSAPPHLNPSTLSVCRSILATDGLRGLYRGLPATGLRDLAYGPYFGTYEAVCRFFKSRKPPVDSPSPHRNRHTSLIDEAEEEMATLTWPELMTAGGLAGVVAWLVTFPLDVFKTRNGSMQRHRSASKPSLYRVGADAIRTEGWRVMFAGLGPTLMRAVPTNMILFLTFEGIVTLLS